VESAFKLRYNPALDGLRGIAIVLVLLSHAHAPMFDGAFFGVDLFFVLSGFLITSLLLMEYRQHGKLDYWRFYRRRFFRLMPALALFLLAYCVFAPLSGQTSRISIRTPWSPSSTWPITALPSSTVRTRCCICGRCRWRSISI
jgi:peptidoglycan/LPS O-acetylase OafA/YrhL